MTPTFQLTVYTQRRVRRSWNVTAALAGSRFFSSAATACSARPRATRPGPALLEESAWALKEKPALAGMSSLPPVERASAGGGIEMDAQQRRISKMRANLQQSMHQQMLEEGGEEMAAALAGDI